jgi:signal transduction histidine kinase
MNLFHSARLKLTGFYFAILVVFCLILSIGVRMFTGYELQQADKARGGAVYQLFERYDDQWSGSGSLPGGKFFVGTEQRQSDLARQHLNRDLLLIDLGLLAIGAFLSYWYAGWTLRPIQQAHEDQKRFTADASHELRTPLASIRLENEVFLRQKRFSEKDARALIASNLEDVARLERLAATLLALNKYEHGVSARQPVATAEWIQEAIERTKHDMGAEETVFNLNVTPATVQGEQESLVELLCILFDNAIKYGPPNGPVDVVGQPHDKHFVVQVRDYGPGIAEEDLAHIFERMYRGDKARSSKVAGHGIGLSLARQIAEANGVGLTAANHPDGGAVFTLTFSSLRYT